METENRKDGKTYIGLRVREEGSYNHSEKWTLTMGISGDVNGSVRLTLTRGEAQQLRIVVILFSEFFAVLVKELHRGDGYLRWTT